MLDKIELAWAAGFFDGEGWFGTADFSSRGPGHQSICLKMHVSQTNREVLVRFQEAMGGLGKIEQLRDRPNRKRVWRWRISGPLAVDAAAKIFDYCCEPKQDQILAAIGRRLAYEELKAAQQQTKNSGHSHLKAVG